MRCGRAECGRHRVRRCRVSGCGGGGFAGCHGSNREFGDLSTGSQRDMATATRWNAFGRHPERMRALGTTGRPVPTNPVGMRPWRPRRTTRVVRVGIGGFGVRLGRGGTRLRVDVRTTRGTWMGRVPNWTSAGWWERTTLWNRSPGEYGGPPTACVDAQWKRQTAV